MVRSARKLVDDHDMEIDDHIKIVENAKHYPNILEDMVSDYSQQLKDLFNKGEYLLSPS